MRRKLGSEERRLIDSALRGVTRARR